MIKHIIIYHIRSLSRLRMSPFLAYLDYIAIFLGVTFVSIVILGIASENSILFYEEKILNYNYIIFSIYLISFFFDSYLNNYYTPNYKYFKLILPTNLKKQLCIDFLFEFFSYKILILFPYLFLFFIFKSYYSLDFNFLISLKGVMFIIISYINSCLLMQLIKSAMKKRAFDFHKNFFKLFFFTLIVIAILNKNLKVINLETIEAMNILFSLSFLLTIFLVFLIIRIALNQDKI